MENFFQVINERMIMEAEIIAGLLGNRSAFTKKYMRFISEDKKTTCEECKKYDKMVFAANDINKPTIPIHPNCRCYYQILYILIQLKKLQSSVSMNREPAFQEKLFMVGKNCWKNWKPDTLPEQ